MPNVSFDIFFDKDFINVTATRGYKAPKAKPEWKVRTLPKLPPKPEPEDHTRPRPPPRDKLVHSRLPQKQIEPAPPSEKAEKSEKTEKADISAASSQAGDQPKRKPPKLGPSKVSEALAPTVSGAVSTAGSFAGGAVSAVGNSINGVGEGINHSIRRYGDGVKDYGNAIMDWTRADGVRAPTANNPLGLSSGVTGGKRQVTSPQLYRPPPKTSASKTLMTTSKTAAPQKKIEAGTPRKALPAPGPKPNGTIKKSTSAAPAPVKKHVAAASSTSKSASTVSKTASTPNPGAMRKKPAETTTKKTGSSHQPASVKKPTPVKSNGVSAAKPTNRPKVEVNHTAAANPLGLKF